MHTLQINSNMVVCNASSLWHYNALLCVKNLFGTKPDSVSDFHSFCFPLGVNQQASLRSVLEHVHSYEITRPTWLHPHRRRRSASEEVSPSESKWFKEYDKICQLSFTRSYFCPCSIRQRQWFRSQLRARSSDCTWRKTSEWLSTPRNTAVNHTCD